jgi:hypothetical protein
MEAAREKRFGQQFLAEKQKLNYACPMTNPSLSAGKNREQPFPFWLGGKRLEKFLSEKIQHNPLKMPDSDERIQGNPSLSNPINEGFRGQTARAQENPNGPTRLNVAPCCWGRRAEPTPSKCEAVQAIGRSRGPQRGASRSRGPAVNPLEGSAEGRLRAVAEAMSRNIDRHTITPDPLGGESHTEFGQVS